MSSKELVDESELYSECCGADIENGICLECHKHAEGVDEDGETMDEKWGEQCDANYRMDQARGLK